MISVDAALQHIFDLITPVETETIPLRAGTGRVLREDIVARRDQPPFAASVMDGYAVRDADALEGGTLSVVGEAAAGRGFAGSVNPGEAVRIFTGAPIPEGADRVVIQEDVTRTGQEITIQAGADTKRYIRDLGTDFRTGDRIAAPKRLSPSDVALAASMNVPELVVSRRPVVALIATGDELVMPGETPGPDQIVASNAFGLSGILEAENAEVRLLPIARDTRASLTAIFDLAKGADLIVTIGGASVGDHDLVGRVIEDLGVDRSFYKVAMRPGKPLMAGRMGGAAMVGLPGNPVSSMVCGHVFLRPAVRALQGLVAGPLPRRSALLAAPIGANGPREHYMRATLTETGHVIAADRQDSSLLSVLAGADCLIVRPPKDGPRDTGETVEIVAL